jgi:hypothetical protein
VSRRDGARTRRFSEAVRHDPVCTCDDILPKSMVDIGARVAFERGTNSSRKATEESVL